MEKSGNICAVCNVEANQVCGACNSVFYCSRNHQKSHWPTHKQQCKPYTIINSEKFGRYMVASRDLNDGDVILREKAILAGPKQDTRPICLTCYEFVNSNCFRCTKCHFPFCNEECAKNDVHAEECEILSRAKNRFIVNNYEDIHPAYECITPLRGLLLKKTQPTNYEALMKLQHHNESRCQRDVWHADQVNTVDYLLQRCSMNPESTEEELQSICGILEVNSFEIKLGPGKYLRGIYPTAAMMAHCCVANSFHIIKQGNYDMILRAAVPIKKGQPIYISYTHSLEGTRERRSNIRFSKFFDCDCLRCSDPTELGTFFSALKCRTCPQQGNILPLNPLSDSSVWKCDSCDYSMTAEQVDQLLAKLKGDFENIGQNETEKFELFLKVHSNKLHNNHYLLTQARHFLSQLYGRDARFLLNNLPEPLLNRKAFICQQLLNVANILEPGISRLRGVTLYELHAPLVLLAKKRYEDDRIGRDEFKEEILKSIDILDESCRILSLEDESSAEGAMAKAAKLTLQQLHRWVAI